MKSVIRLSVAGLLAVALTGAWPGAATAVQSLTLSGPITGNTVGPESVSNPCIISGTNCPNQSASMGFNNFDATGNVSSYNMYSTTPTATLADGVQGMSYTVGQLTGVLGSTDFVVAIDVNTTGAQSETLSLFEVFIGGALAYNYVGPTVIGNVNNNGEGWADWTLGNISLAGLAPNTQVYFHAVWSNAVDGAESFFLVHTDSSTVPAPEPSTVVLLGTTLVGLSLIRLRRKWSSAA